MADYVGAQDANCNPLGIMSFVRPSHSKKKSIPDSHIRPQLKLLQSPFQAEFLVAPDIPWPTADSDEATMRVVGEGAGNMTWILIDGGGHFVGDFLFMCSVVDIGIPKIGRWRTTSLSSSNRLLSIGLRMCRSINCGVETLSCCDCAYFPWICERINICCWRYFMARRQNQGPCNFAFAWQINANDEPLNIVYCAGGMKEVGAEIPAQFLKVLCVGFICFGRKQPDMKLVRSCTAIR
jgi:hypothetical protein